MRSACWKAWKRINTMSTSGSGFGLPDGFGLPEVDTLTRLANQFFNDWPGKDAATSVPVAQALRSDVPLGRTVAPSIALPGEAELKALLDSLWPGVPASTEAAVPPLSVPAFGAPFDVNLVRQDFPILQEQVNGRSLVWLDNAATTQKPQAVIDRLKYFYEHENSNIHRAAHELAARATDAYEEAREKVRGFLNASSVKEIVFVRGATEAINLVAQSWGLQFIGKDDEIVITWLEHHANIVPWQQLANEKGARLRVAPVDDNGQILLNEYTKLLGSKTKLVSFPQVSNALGTVTPAKQIIEAAHAAIGVLYGKEALLNEAPPWQGGGNMIPDVTFERSLFQPAPGRFEAGTGNIADAVGLGAALDYVSKIGLQKIEEYEHQLLIYATRLLKEIPGLQLIDTAPEKAGVLSFVLDGHKTEDIGTALNREGIAVRAGHHCAQPILRRFGVESTVRPSL